MEGLAAGAQDSPKFEGLIGFSNVHLGQAQSTGTPAFILRGGNGSISFNPIPALGIVDRSGILVGHGFWR